FPVLFFRFTPRKAYVGPNWPFMAYPPFLAMAVMAGPGIRLQKITRGIWSGVLLVILGLVITRYSPFSKPIKSREFFEFEELYGVAREKSPLFARSYQMASRLSFEMKKPIYKLRGFNRRDAYDFWEGSLPPSHF